MLQRPERLLTLALGLAFAGSCRHATPDAALAPGWEALQSNRGGFAALYRLACCGHRELLATVRAGERGLWLTVVAPPGATVVQCWVDAGGGWIAEDGGRCRRPLAAGLLPLPDGTVLPLDHRMAAVLLSGRLPAGGEPAPGGDGWVTGVEGKWTWRARVVGSPPRCVRLQIGRAAAQRMELDAELRDHRGSVPGALTLRVGDERVEAVLQEWRSSATLEEPPWLAAPDCGGGS